MMRWFKCLDPRSMSMLEAKQAIGDGGMWQIACLIHEAQQQDVWDLDVETIIGWIKVKRDRAEKILPFAQKILQESAEIFSKSPKNLSKSQEILSKSKDFTPSNPHGSTRDQEQNREEQNRKEKNNTQPKAENNSSLRCLGKSPRQQAMSLEDAEKDAEFERWYAAYPRRDAKGHARKAYWAARKKVSAEVLLEGISRYRDNKPHYADWKMPATWLNGECWADEDYKPGNTTAANVEQKPKGLIARIQAAEEVEINSGGESFWVPGKTLQFQEGKNLFILDGREYYVDQISITREGDV